MKKIFIGFLILSLRIKWTVGSSMNMNGIMVQDASRYIEILPPFVGWLIILWGVKELREREHVYEDRLFNLLYVTVGISIFFFVNNILGLWVNYRINALINFLMMVIEFFIFYFILKGYHEIEINSSKNLYAEKTLKYLYIQTGLSFLALIFLSLPIIAIILLILLFIMRVLLLIGFYKAQRAYLA